MRYSQSVRVGLPRSCPLNLLTRTWYVPGTWQHVVYVHDSKRKQNEITRGADGAHKNMKNRGVGCCFLLLVHVAEPGRTHVLVFLRAIGWWDH